MMRRIGRWLVAMSILAAPAVVWAADAAAKAACACSCSGCPFCH